MLRTRLFIFLLCSCGLAQLLHAQDTDHATVRRVVQDYIDGTSFNRPELLERAFHPDITMYFTRNDQLWMPTHEEYIGFFRKGEAGTPTGRQGNIRLIEVASDVATARAEILVLKNGRLFIDYFLLKRHAGEWRIVSKTASNGPSVQHGGRILIVTSNADRYAGTELPTANHFGEITHAYDVFARAGYTVDLVSPAGGPVAVSYINTTDSLDAAYLRDAELWYRLNHTLAAAEVDGTRYDAIYFPGGGAMMFGVADDPAVQRLIREVYEAEGAVAAVCHGTAGITGTTLSDGTPLLRGRKITGFPDALEKRDGPRYASYPRYIDASVRAQGGDFRAAPQLNAGFYLVDGRFVTGMDHSATRDVASEVVRLLGR